MLNKTFFRSIILSTILVTSFIPLQAQQLYINEFVSSNSSGITDIDGDFPDWVEIYNAGETSVNLKGFGLSDDKDRPLKWTLPEIYIPARGYLLVFASDKNRKYYSPHLETVIDWGDEWHYKPGSADIPANWNTLDFDDSDWLSGKSGFGYGDNDDNTVVDKTISVFIRKTFSVEEVTNISKILLNVDYDDGFVAYLNGNEIARANMWTAGSEASYNRIASSASEAVIYSGGVPELFDVSEYSEYLLNGVNVLAIQVHNRSEDSSDLTMIPFLTLEMAIPSENPRGVAEILNIERQYLHTSFKISKDGEYLSIADASGNILDHIDPIEVDENFSYGRYPDGSDEFYYFDELTPGKSNSSQGFHGISDLPEFNYPAGFYDNPIGLIISIENADLDIYYTVDGSEPTINSLKYSMPINIDETTVVRARGLGSGSSRTDIITQTYLINESTTLPVISLSTNPENLWDNETGIYVEGIKGITGYCSSDPMNWNQDWERQGYIEFFETDKTLGFDINCGIKIGGACTRKYPQKTLAIYTRSEYGDSKIHYKIFPEKKMVEYNNINIRNGGQDWWRAMIRDGVMQTIVANQMDIDYDAYRPMVLFINGEYWGLHGLREKHNEHFIAGNHNLDPDEIDILKGNAELVQGSADHYNQMMSFIKNHDMTLSENYDYVKTQMDVDNYIDYQIAEIYFANIDWPGGNIKYWRPQTDSGKWRWILFDTDLGFGAHQQGQYNSNSLANATSPTETYYANPSWSTLLFRSLLENEEFRNEFVQRYCVHMSTTFDKSRVLNIIDSLKTLVVDEMPHHLEKWPQSTSFQPSWQDHIDIMDEFAILRPKEARQHLVDKWQLENSSTITLITDLSKGEVRVEGVKILEPVTRFRLFNDIDTRFEAEGNSDNSFSGWTGILNSSSNTISLSFSGNDTVYANFGSPNAIEETEIPNAFILNDNYPNPFNPTTMINYQLAMSNDVQLCIFNTRGEKVTTLASGIQAAGSYSVTWDATGFASGIYFYQLKVDGKILTKKCLLMK